MKRSALFCLVSFALLAVLPACGPAIQPAAPEPPAREPGSSAPAPSVLSEILFPAVIQADKLVVVSVGYYMGETSTDGSHNLTCSYLDTNGRSVVIESWKTSGKNQVEVHPMGLQIQKPGTYFIDCDIDQQSQKMVRFQVIEDVQKEVEAVVTEVTSGPSGDSGVNFYIIVSYIYGSPPGGNLLCSYPGEDGRAVKKTFSFTRPDPVDEYAGQRAQLQLDITVKKPGKYMVTCAVERDDFGSNVERSAAIEVKDNVLAAVRAVSVTPADILGQKFHVVVTTNYGADSSTEVLCAYPDEKGAPAQQKISFVRPDPVKQYLGVTREDAFDILVTKPGAYEVGCRVDPGGAEQSARFEVREAAVLAINTLLTETGQNAGNQLIFKDQVTLKYDPKEKTLTGTLVGETSGESSDDCLDSGGGVIAHNTYGFAYNTQAQVNSPLTLGQEAKIPLELAAYVRITVINDSHVCDPVSGDMNLTWNGTLTILLAEDGSYTLTTHIVDSMGAAWQGTAAGKAEPAAEN